MLSLCVALRSARPDASYLPLHPQMTSGSDAIGG
jgi:hypothetical protein